MLRMRDISAFQGKPDIERDFPDAHVIAAKATEGTGYRSPSFQFDWRSIKAAGKERIAYHFFHPSISPVAQARFFIDTVANSGIENGDMFCIDMEDADGLPAIDVSTAAIEFARLVDVELKCRTWVYANESFVLAGNCNGLEDRPLWIANPSTKGDAPVIPHPFTTWIAWQRGILRGVDFDTVNTGSIEHLFQYGALVKSPELGKDELLVRLSTDTVELERVIHISKIVPGFALEIDGAKFKILETTPLPPDNSDIGVIGEFQT
jgi:Glycosyl hydrolases family 25